jgi:hypothetical protein
VDWKPSAALWNHIEAILSYSGQSAQIQAYQPHVPKPPKSRHDIAQRSALHRLISLGFERSPIFSLAVVFSNNVFLFIFVARSYSAEMTSRDFF